MNRKTIRILLLLTVLSCRLLAQPPVVSTFERVDGLSQNTAYSMMKDRQGFLWIATANGLNRYDGAEMKVYKPAIEKKEGQMQGRVIRSDLLEDEQERIWFSTDIAVHSFDKKTELFTVYDLFSAAGHAAEAAQTGGLVANPLIITGGHLWLASAAHGVCDLDIRTKKVIHYPVPFSDEAGNSIQLMYNGAFDGKSTLWFASSDGLLSFDIDLRQWKQHVSGRSFYSLAYCRDTLYISDGKELAALDLAHFQFSKPLFSVSEGVPGRDVIHRVYTDQAANVWTGDEKGNVYCKPFHQNRFYPAGNINSGAGGKTHYPVYSFFADTASGILWTGSYMLGLLKTEASRQGFSTYPGEDETKDNFFVNTIYEEEDGRLLLGTFENGILVLDKISRKITPLKLPYTGPRMIYGNSVPLIQADTKGNVWTSLSGHLYMREKGKTGFLSIPIPPPSNALQVPQLWSLSAYKGGWLLGTTVGLYLLSLQEGKYMLRHLSHFGQKRVVDSWVAWNGEVWIAFESGGVTIVNDIERPGAVQKLFTEANIRSFLPDREHDLLWMAGSGGLIACHLPTRAFRNFTEEDGLANSYVCGILPGNNELWISTNNGLSRALLSFTPGHALPSVRFINFNSSDGLPDNTFNTKAFYKDKTGTLFFGTARGLTWFRPEDIKSRQHLPVIQMTGLRVNEQVADSTTAPQYIRQLVLPYHQNSLFFRFRGIDYTNPRRVYYEYKLQGWDNDWIYSGTVNEVRYNRLPPGDYVFQVRAGNGSGAWSEEVYRIAVLIRPPFWNTWWFYLLSGIAVVAMIIVITRSVVRRKLKMKILELEKQKELEKERQRISREMHDDIGSGLTQIALMSESARKYEGAAKEEQLEEIAGTSRRLVANMGEIIWSLSPAYKTFGDLVVYLREQLYKTLEHSGKEYAIDLPDDGSDMLLTNQQRRNIVLVVKEVVNNSIRHSGATAINVKGEWKGGTFAITVEDNGQGFDPQKNYAGNGLKNIRYRVQELRGEMTVQSSAGHTCLSFSVPLR